MLYSLPSATIYIEYYTMPINPYTIHILYNRWSLVRTTTGLAPYPIYIGYSLYYTRYLVLIPIGLVLDP